MKKYYAVIDTNVVVSAFLKSNSIPDTVLSLALSGIIIPLINDAVLREYRDVLSRGKFGFDLQSVADFVEQIEKVAVSVDAESLDTAMPDVKDKVFYEIVMEKRKTDESYLVTGNIKHFPSAPYIVTPKEMLEIIAGENSD